MSERPSFQEELERLEAIVRELERNDLDLDRALTLFEDGVQHLRRARDLLDVSEQRVRKVLADTDGTVAEDDGDP